MKARVTIEYIPNGDLAALRDQEGQHWSTRPAAQRR